MTALDIGGIIVAIVAALGAWAAQRAASNATKTNTEVSGRLEAERGAYERARVFDTETIRRQNEEILELRKENERLKKELAQVKARLRKLETSATAIKNIERLLHDRLDDPDAVD